MRLEYDIAFFFFCGPPIVIFSHHIPVDNSRLITNHWNVVIRSLKFLKVFQLFCYLSNVFVMQVKESVHAFSWEPVGSKFAVIHGESQSLNVSFYELKV